MSKYRHEWRSRFRDGANVVWSRFNLKCVVRKVAFGYSSTAEVLIEWIEGGVLHEKWVFEEELEKEDKDA